MKPTLRWKPKKKMSNLAAKVEKILKKGFPMYRIGKEYYVSYQATSLFFDFHLPEIKVVIEVQGQQHYSFNKFFHRDKADFDAQQYRDRLKTEWCSLQKYTLVTLKYDEIDSLTAASLKEKIIREM